MRHILVTNTLYPRYTDLAPLFARPGHGVLHGKPAGGSASVPCPRGPACPYSAHADRRDFDTEWRSPCLRRTDDRRRAACHAWTGDTQGGGGAQRDDRAALQLRRDLAPERRRAGDRAFHRGRLRWMQRSRKTTPGRWPDAASAPA